MKKMWFAVVCVLAGLASAGWSASAADTRVSFSRAVKAAGPAVVNIYAAKVVPVERAVADEEALRGLDGKMRQRISKSLGSGVIVRADGIMVTNLHVIAGADAAKAVLADGREFGVKILGQDEKLDIAVLKVLAPAGAALPVAKLGDSDSLDVGDVVLAVGNPYGIGQSVSLGVVSAVQRSNAALSPYGQFIQTDADINPGSSGGALVDSTGAVVGINTAIYTRNGGSQGLGFATPANMVRQIVQDVVQVGHVVRPWLGAEGQAMTRDVARELGLTSANGVLLTSVVGGSPAALAGLRRGDVIVRLNGRDVADPAALGDQIMATTNLLNKPVPMVIWRSGKMQEVLATLTALPSRLTAQQLVVKGYNPMSGCVLEPLSPALNVELGLGLATKGVAVVDTPAKPPYGAFKQTFQAGDIVLAVNGQNASDPKSVQAALDGERRVWKLRFMRDGRVSEVVIQ